MVQVGSGCGGGRDASFSLEQGEEVKMTGDGSFQ